MGENDVMKLLGAVAAAVVVAAVPAGCSYGPATSPRPTSSSVGASPEAAPDGASILPGTALLGGPLTAKGATVTPRADTMALARQDTGEDLELGIEVTFADVSAPIDATGPNGGFRLLVSGGEQIAPSRPVVLKSRPLPARVIDDVTGWVFFHLKPGALPTQLQLTAAPANYMLDPQPIAIWAMSGLPAASGPEAPPGPLPPARPPAPAEPAPAPPPASDNGGNGGPRGPRLPPPPQLPRPQLPSPPQLPPPPPSVCRHTPLC